MAELFLVRHGQASYGAANYDKLSDLGHQQARWLGEHYRDAGLTFDHIITGDMVRHRETAAGLCQGLGIEQKQFDTHTGLNEFEFESICRVFLDNYPEHTPAADSSRSDHYRLLRKAMLAWSEDKLDGPLPESWQGFRQRVEDALTYIQSHADKERLLVVSSGGAMAMAMSIVLGTGAQTVVELNLQTRNTGVSRYFFNQKGLRLSGFNHTPHLDSNERQQAITFS